MRKGGGLGCRCSLLGIQNLMEPRRGTWAWRLAAIDTRHVAQRLRSRDGEIRRGSVNGARALRHAQLALGFGLPQAQVRVALFKATNTGPNRVRASCISSRFTPRSRLPRMRRATTQGSRRSRPRTCRRGMHATSRPQSPRCSDERHHAPANPAPRSQAESKGPLADPACAPSPHGLRFAAWRSWPAVRPRMRGLNLPVDQTNSRPYRGAAAT